MDGAEWEGYLGGGREVKGEPRSRGRAGGGFDDVEHREVSGWQKLLEHLLSDKEMLAGVRLKFRDLYREVEGSGDPSEALEALLGGLPAVKKTH